MRMPVNRESDTPMGAYQVWHREGDDFQQVGSLKVANLLVAAEVAMTRPPSHWMDEGENGRVPLDARQTRMGDVITAPDGGAFKLVETAYGFTFEQTDFAMLRKDVALFAEVRDEARTGAADGLKAGSLFADVLREAGVYGVKADEVEAIRDEQERGR